MNEIQTNTTLRYYAEERDLALKLAIIHGLIGRNFHISPHAPRGSEGEIPPGTYKLVDVQAAMNGVRNSEPTYDVFTVFERVRPSPSKPANGGHDGDLWAEDLDLWTLDSILGWKQAQEYVTLEYGCDEGSRELTLTMLTALLGRTFKLDGYEQDLRGQIAPMVPGIYRLDGVHDFVDGEDGTMPFLVKVAFVRLYDYVDSDEHISLRCMDSYF